MGLGQALSAAVSGLRVTQSNLALIASNIANAETPGYVRKSGSQVAAAIANEAVKATEAKDTVLSPYIAGFLKESLIVGLDASAKVELGAVSLPGDVLKF